MESGMLLRFNDQMNIVLILFCLICIQERVPNLYVKQKLCIF